MDGRCRDEFQFHVSFSAEEFSIVNVESIQLEPCRGKCAGQKNSKRPRGFYLFRQNAQNQVKIPLIGKVRQKIAMEAFVNNLPYRFHARFGIFRPMLARRTMQNFPGGLRLEKGFDCRKFPIRRKPRTRQQQGSGRLRPRPARAMRNVRQRTTHGPIVGTPIKGTNGDNQASCVLQDDGIVSGIPLARPGVGEMLKTHSLKNGPTGGQRVNQQILCSASHRICCASGNQRR